METKLGKIRSLRFGMGGYQDAMIGVTFELGAKGWGVRDFWGAWAMEPSEGTKWTAAERNTQLGITVMRIKKLLEEAGVNDLSDLKDVPVEIEFDGNSLKSWRVLTEVIE